MQQGAMGHDMCTDQTLAEFLEMGFEFNQVTKAIESVGPHRDNVLELLLNPSHDILKQSQNRSASSMKQPSIKDHISRFGGRKRKFCSTSVCDIASEKETTAQTELQCCEHDNEQPRFQISNSDDSGKKPCGPCRSFLEGVSISQEASKSFENIDNKLKNHISNLGGCEKKPGISSNICGNPAEKEPLAEEASYNCKIERMEAIMQKHFGFSSLKGFQKEALDTWSSNKDCLVLAATGSGTYLFLRLRVIFFFFHFLFRPGIYLNSFHV